MSQKLEKNNSFFSLQDPVWLKDEDAVEFSEWMEYWESPEGIKKGGPPKAHEVCIIILTYFKLKKRDVIGFTFRQT